MTALDFSADSNEKYVLYVHFCFFPFEIMSLWYARSEIWQVSAHSSNNLNISHFPLAPNPSLLEHQVIVLQTYVFSLPSAKVKGVGVDLWRTKYCWELNVHQNLVCICSLVTACHTVSVSSSAAWCPRNTTFLWYMGFCNTVVSVQTRVEQYQWPQAKVGMLPFNIRQCVTLPQRVCGWTCLADKSPKSW